MPEFEIQLRDIMMYGCHGVMAEEHITGNQYRVNVRLRFVNTSFDENTDDIASTISYADIYNILQGLMEVQHSTLEAIAVRFSKKVKNQWPFIQSGEIEIVKTVPPIPGLIGEAGVKYIF